MNEIAVFQDSTAVVYFDKKGNHHELSAEGALFKGGAALASLKDLTMKAAGNKAANGKYRAAADILAAAFPSVGKGFDKLVGTPWANKSSMGSFLKAIERAEPGKNGYTTKQQQARDFVRALRTIPALAADVSEAVTIDAPTLRRAA
jgi:uncharacterized protein (DUF2132 family)